LIATPDSEVLESESFTVMGLNPRRSRELYFHHERLGLGKFLTLQGHETGQRTVQLVPCGVVSGRIVEASNKPVPNVQVQLSWLTEGYCQTVARTTTDADGRFCMDGLVPGVKCKFVLVDSRRLRTSVDAVEVKSGESKDLGELVLDK
jgi:hypothetical protein